MLYWLAFLVVRPLIAPYAVSLGASTTQSALLVSSSAIIAFFAALPVGNRMDRVDPRDVTVIGSVMMFGAGLLLVAIPGWVGLLVSQLLLGVGSLMVWLSIQDLMARGPRSQGREVHIDSHRRHRQIVNYTMFVAVGQLTGPVIGGWIADDAGARTAFVAFLIMCAVMVGFAVFYPRLSEEQAALAQGARSLGQSFGDGKRLATHPAGRAMIVVSFLTLWVTDLRVSFLALVLQEAGMSLARAGSYLSLAAGLAILSRPLLPVLLRRLGMSMTTAVCLVPGALLLSGVALTTEPWLLLVLITGHGLCIGLAQPLTLSMVAVVVTERRRGVGLAGRLMANRAAQWAAPVGLAALGAALPVGAAFAVAVGASAPFGLLAAVRSRTALSAPPWDGEAVARRRSAEDDTPAA